MKKVTEKIVFKRGFARNLIVGVRHFLSIQAYEGAEQLAARLESIAAESRSTAPAIFVQRRLARFASHTGSFRERRPRAHRRRAPPHISSSLYLIFKSPAPRTSTSEKRLVLREIAVVRMDNCGLLEHTSCGAAAAPHIQAPTATLAHRLVHTSYQPLTSATSCQPLMSTTQAGARHVRGAELHG